MRVLAGSIVGEGQDGGSLHEHRSVMEGMGMDSKVTQVTLLSGSNR